MRLLMAVSADGYLCSGPGDDMSWTGQIDKFLFRALTGVGGVCAAGQTTWSIMPRLSNRQFIPISRESYTLQQLEDRHPDAWLLGGPTVAKAALRLGLVREFHRSTIVGIRLRRGVHSDVLGSLPRPAMSTRYREDVRLDVLRLGPGE